MRFDDAFAMTFEECYEGTASEKLSSLNAASVASVLGWDRDMSLLTTRDLTRLTRRLSQQGNSNATINRKLSLLSKVLSYTKEQGFIDNYPTIKRLKEQQTKLRWLSQEESDRLIDGCKDEELRRFIIISLDTGVRLSELLNFARDSAKEKLIYLWNTKANKERSIPLTNRAMDALTMQMASTEEEKLWSFNKNQLSYKFYKLVTRLELKDVTIHTMRHTFCSRLVARGASLGTIRDLAGHSSIAVTNRYVHTSPADKRQAIELLES